MGGVMGKATVCSPGLSSASLRFLGVFARKQIAGRISRKGAKDSKRRKGRHQIDVTRVGHRALLGSNSSDADRMQ